MTQHALVTTGEGLLRLLGFLEDAPEIALDTETYPMDDSNSALDPRRGKVRLISVAAEGGVGGVVDVTKVDPGPLLEALRRKPLIAHNASFDLSFLKNRFGHEHDGPVFDTQVFDAVLYYADGPRVRKGNWAGFPENEVRQRSLGDVANDYLGVELDKEEQTSDFGREELTEAQVRYSSKDAEFLLPIAREMRRRLRKLGLEQIANLEARVTPALAYCENNGFALDVRGWREQAARAKEKAARLGAVCDSIAPLPPDNGTRVVRNWRSPKQVGEAFELLGTELPKTPKGNPKTDEETLRGLCLSGEAARLAETLLRLREAEKRVSTWGLGWFDPPKKTPTGKKFDKPRCVVVDGRAFASFRQVVKTGRMSSSGPNLQNIPAALKRYFVAPPGRKLLIADYRHVELVPAAVVSGEEKMIKAFRQGIDVHSLTARRMLEAARNPGDGPISEKEVANVRPLAKEVTFGILYGSTAHGLAKNITKKLGVKATHWWAQELIDEFSRTYPSLARWCQQEKDKADAGDDRTRTLAGRPRLLDVRHTRGRWRAEPSVRLNTPIQGSAGDGLKYALALLWSRRRECPGSPKIVNLVHDEIVVEIDEKHAEAGKAWLERYMLEGMAVAVGRGDLASVEIAIADNWGKQ